MNHRSFSQKEWNSSKKMDLLGWKHSMEFWVFDHPEPDTIRITVGEAGNPHR